MKLIFEKAIETIQEEIIAKEESNNSQIIDKEVLAWINVYKNGRKDFKLKAENWLTNFFINSEMVSKKSDLIFNAKEEEV